MSLRLDERPDAWLREMIRKFDRLGVHPASEFGRMRAEMVEELDRRARVDRLPDAINPAHPWLIELSPGRWVTASNAELRAAHADALGRGLSPAQWERAITQLLKEGRIRPNPARTRTRESR